MPININLNTVLAGSGYFAGLEAERYDEEEDGLLTIFVKRDAISIRQEGLVASLVFNNVPDGRHRFCIRDSNDKLRWRSPILRTETGNETFAFHIIAVDPAETTFDAGQFENEMDLPITEDIPNLDEDLNITSVDVTILSSHIDIDGDGKIAKGDDWTILGSEFDFDYDFNLRPRNTINHETFARVDPVTAITLNLDNPITGFGAWFLQDKINSMIRRTIQNIVNNQIRRQLETRTETQFGDNEANALITATLIDTDIIQDGTTDVDVPGGTVTVPVNKLRFLLDISIPSSLIPTGNGGCFGTFLFILLLIMLSVLLVVPA